MPEQLNLPEGSLSRRNMLRVVAGCMLALSIESCAQAGSTSSASPTPTHISALPMGKLLVSYRKHTKRVTAVGWSPDGTYIASGSLDETVQVWPANSSSASSAFQPFVYRGHTAGVTALTWSPDSRRVASGADDMTVQLWDALTGGNVIVCRGHTNSITALSWSPDGKYVASSSADGTVRIWDAATGAQHYVYRGHTDSVNTVAWSPDGQRLASGSTDKTVQLWDALTGGHVFTYRGHTGTVSSVSWAPDGSRLVSGSWDKTAQVWYAASGKVAYIYNGYNVQIARTNTSKGVLPDLIFIVAWSHNGKRIVIVTQVYCGDNCGVVVAWDADTERNVTFYIDTPIFALAWSPDDTRFVTATDVTTQGAEEAPKANDPEAGPYAQIVVA
jgi:WD40 repeat protein